MFTACVLLVSSLLTADERVEMLEANRDNVLVLIRPGIAKPSSLLKNLTLPLPEDQYFFFVPVLMHVRRPIKFSGWGPEPDVRLRDDLGNQYRMIEFDFEEPVKELDMKQTIELDAGTTFVQFLVFEIPVEEANSFTLTLKGDTVGEKRDLVFEFPRSEIKDQKKRDEAREKARWRVWTSADGKFSVEAKFLRAGAGIVVLQRKDGKEIEVRQDKLSEEDTRWIRTGKWKVP